MPEVVEMTTKEAVKVALSGAESPMGPREAADVSGKNYNTVRAVLRTMFNQRQVVALKNNTYCLPDQFPDLVRRVGIQGQPESSHGSNEASRIEKAAGTEMAPASAAAGQAPGHPAIVFRAGGKVLFSIYIQAVPGQTLSVDVETPSESSGEDNSTEKP